MSGDPGAAAHSRSADEVLAELAVSPDSGLSRREASRRLRVHGPNRLREARSQSAWTIFFSQFKSLIVVFLAAAAGVSVVAGDLLEAAAVGAVILVNGLIGFVSELQAVRSMEALRKLGSVPATVRRDGEARRVSAERLVPGDIVLVEGGDVVTADLRMIEASKIEANESALTGESLPVEKHVEPLPAQTLLPERANMLYKGTSVTRGAGAAVVVATGMATELGAISALVDQSLDTAETPIEQRLNRLGTRLIWLTLGITLVVAASGLIAGRDPFVVIKTAIALAVAAIPEGLPIVATLALARGMWRMSNRNALMKRLAAVETLGATDIIFTDKTGTLTEGQMAVRRIVTAGLDVRVTGGAFDADGSFERDGGVVEPPDDPGLKALLEASVLCTDASWNESAGARGAVGDPVEVALLVAGRKAGLDRSTLLRDLPEVREEAFDSDVKMMATFHRTDEGVRVAVKGAPETVLEASARVRDGDSDRALSAEQRDEWLARNEALAEGGLRVLAVAEKKVTDAEAAPYEDLRFLGFVGLVDPPRADIQESLAKCLGAGIRVVMLTGDQEATARYVAREVGLHDDENALVIEGHELRPPEELSDEAESRLLATSTFARVTPKQKLDLVQLAQRHGHIVAMTGDGVNDAPALQQADIGIAMGMRGTQVAREAADMILQDDAFPTIVAAVEQGRVIYDNIRTFIRYLISCNVSEILVVFLASVVNAPLPLLPMQILFLNLVTDVFPALALGLGEGDRMVMDRDPRDPEEPFLTKGHWTEIVSYGALIAAAVLGALALALRHYAMSEPEAVTVSFLTLALAQLWHVLNMRAPQTRLTDNAIVKNPYVWGAIALCLVLVAAAVYLPGLATVLSTADPGPDGWTLAFLMSLIPLAGGQLWLAIRARAR